MKQLAFEALKIQRVNFITPKLGAPCINLGQISCDGESSTAAQSAKNSKFGCVRGARLARSIKSGIFDQPEAKVHLGQAWRIEFSYRNIHEH